MTDQFDRFTVNNVRVDCSDTFTALTLEVSRDGGKTWGNWIQRSVGKVGEYFPRLLWTRLGSARDRVWRLRYSGNTAWTIVSGVAR